MSPFIARHDHHLVAISVGATCFGALTTNIYRQRTEPARQGNRGAREDRDAELLRLRFQIRPAGAGTNFRSRLDSVLPELTFTDCADPPYGQIRPSASLHRSGASGRSRKNLRESVLIFGQ
jgi:hypothetical protein